MMVMMFGIPTYTHCQLSAENLNRRSCATAHTGEPNLMTKPIHINRAPCQSCPYRRDVPSGIWAHEEYEKILDYDNETGHQPMKVFMCHQAEQVNQ